MVYHADVELWSSTWSKSCIVAVPSLLLLMPLYCGA